MSDSLVIRFHGASNNERCKKSRQLLPLLLADLCNKICRERRLAIKAAEPIGLAVDGGRLSNELEGAH